MVRGETACSGRGVRRSTRQIGGWLPRRPSPTCACWPVAELRAPSSTTPMAPPVTSSLFVGLAQVYERLEFSPHVLQDVSSVDTSTVILGRPAAAPFGFAPTGFTRMMHTDGEPAVARVAERAGIPYALSTMGTTSIEDLAAAAPDGRRWFQLYLWRDREASRDFVARAAAAGYGALVLTVDTPVPGSRLRDVRNGLTIPPSLSLKTFAEGALASRVVVRPPHHRAARVRLAQALRGHPQPSSSPACSTRPRRSPTSPGSAPSGTGRSLVKGILNAADARAVVDAGADAVVVSNHGDDSSTGPPPRWRRCPRWSTRWATGPRCTSTEASCRAAT